MQCETRNPSDMDAQAHVERAASMLTELEADTGPLTNPQIRGLVAAVGALPSGPSTETAKSKEKRRGGGGKAAIPSVAASNARTRTAADFTNCGRESKKAKLAAETCLNEALMVHLDEEKVRCDPSLDLLRSRLVLVTMAMDDDAGASSIQKSEALFNAAIDDPYLKDLRTTVLSEMDGCQTYGRIMRTRKIDLEVQPTVEAVARVADTHKNAINLLKTIASCLLKESQAWLAQTKALIQAKRAEEEAVRRAEEKAEKEELRAQERARAKAVKQAERAEKAKGKLVEADGDSDNSQAADKKKKRRQKLPQGVFNEDDPPVPKNLAQFPSFMAAEVVGEVEQLIESIITFPNRLCVGRFKRGAFRKVLKKYPEGVLSTTSVGNYIKNISSSLGQFKNQCTAAFQQDQTGLTTKLALVSEGPGGLLAADMLLQQQIDNLLRDTSMHELDTPVVMDRDYLADMRLVAFGF